MSHGGMGGGHGHGGHHGGHHGNHGGYRHHGAGHGHHGHHGGGFGTQIMNASTFLYLTQGLIVTMFPNIRGFDRREVVPDPWTSSLQPPTWKQRLLYMDLRPLILLTVFLGGLSLYYYTIYRLRHADDPTGKTFSQQLSPQAAPISRAYAPMMPPGAYGPCFNQNPQVYQGSSYSGAAMTRQRTVVLR